jgi:hypothetical protein
MDKWKTQLEFASNSNIRNTPSLYKSFFSFSAKEINLFSLTPTPSRQQQQQHHHLPSSFTPNQHAIIDSCSLGSRLHVKVRIIPILISLLNSCSLFNSNLVLFCMCLGMDLWCCECCGKDGEVKKLVFKCWCKRISLESRETRERLEISSQFWSERFVAVAEPRNQFKASITRWVL